MREEKIRAILTKHGVVKPIFEDFPWGTYWRDGPPSRVMREGQIVGNELHEWPAKGPIEPLA